MSANLEQVRDAMLPLRYRIDEVVSELPSGEVFSWTLSPLDGEPLACAPGQFNMLYQPGIGEVPISISGDTAGPLVHTIRAVGAVTRVMQDLRPGAVIGLRGPFGSTWPMAAARGRDVILIAGGIGLAPLRPVMYRLLAEREAYGRIFLLYGTRQPEDILYRRELEQWRARLDLDVAVTVDRGAPGWGGNVGVVTKLIDRGGFDPASCIAMLCGPEVMMRYAVIALHRQGLRDPQIHLSMERNMKCAVGYCGHCQFGPHFICKDGPVFRFDAVSPFFDLREL